MMNWLARLLSIVLVGVFVSVPNVGLVQAQSSFVETHLAYTGEVVGVASGGVGRGAVYLDNVDVTVTLKGDSLVQGTGLTAHIHGLGTQGGNPSALVGDAQITSNIEAPPAWRIYEAWLQYGWSRASLLVGLYDLNAEFDVNRTGSLFLNSSHGIGASFGASGSNGPSIFPVTSLAARLRVRVSSKTYVQAAVMDGVPGRPSEPGATVVRFAEGDGVLLAAELGMFFGASGPSSEALVDRTVPVDACGTLTVGGWAYSTELREWPTVHTPSGVRRSGGSVGFYALAEGQLYRESGTEAQGLSAFGRVGWANDRHNRFGGYTGSGVVYTGLLPGRGEDRAGVAVASAYNGAAYKVAQRRAGRPVTDAEINLEFTYAAAITPWFTLTGDVQYVFNPNTDPSLPNALFVGLRAAVEL